MTSERRSLVEGIKSTAPKQNQVEQDFVFADAHGSDAEAKPRPITTDKDPARQERPNILPQLSNRVPITTRTRPEVASALKRASLQRQLDGEIPYYVQDILEAALETWLRDNGYLA